jgi:pimeloyl-ACP methyl ester carboxylesterase
MEITVRDIEANGWRFHCREAGGSGEPVILLHGFPETSRMWEPLMATLAAEGYRCVAPDQRGYSPGARPQEADAYRYADLAADVLELARVLGFQRFHLVGHDWGAAAGWAALAVRPDPVRSWTALPVPHYLAFARAVRDDPDEELYRGILGLLLATDGSTEAAFAADDFAALRGVWERSTPEEVEDYLTVFGQPGASAAALNWYRACRGHASALDDDSFVFGPVATPTLLLWGKDDPYIRRMSVDLATEYMTGPYRTVELDAGHFLAQEAPQAVADEICAHLRQNPL